MKPLIALTLIVALAGGGCTHSLKISKAPKLPTGMVAPEKKVAIGFKPVANQPLLQAAINRIQAEPAVARSEQNFKYGNGFNPDYVSELSILTNRHKACGENFLITFPGFIVFTHAWLGYRYKVEMETQSRLYDSDANLVSEEIITTPFEFRHCSFARGAASGICGWLLPGYGGAAVIPGVIFAASYDKRANEPFVQKALNPYAEYVSGQVLRQLRDLETKTQGLTAMTPADVMVITEEDPGSSSAFTEDHYAVYIVRIGEDGESGPEFDIKELSPAARGTMDFMSRTGVVAADSDLGALLEELGVSPGDTAGHMDEVHVMTQVGEEVRALEANPFATAATY